MGAAELLAQCAHAGCMVDSPEGAFVVNVSSTAKQRLQRWPSTGRVSIPSEKLEELELEVSL